MHALAQRLRELDWDTFQRFAQQLLAQRHPGLNIKHVEGAGGDRGLDLFAGTLCAGPTIWQCKHFPNGFSSKQRPQVLKSLRDAVDNFAPKRWVLVTSIDLDTNGHEWFQQLTRKYANITSLELIQGSDLVQELIHRRSIRDAFFPGAVLDTISVRRVQGELGSMDRESLDRVSIQNSDEQIARLEETDGRFHYGIAYGPNLGSNLALTTPTLPSHVASVFDGAKRIDVFARDVQAIRLDPPRITFSANRAGQEKLQQFLRTGKPQQLLPSEISIPQSSFDFLLPDVAPTTWQLHVLPSAQITSNISSLRVTVSRAEETLQYEFIRFRTLSVGQEQVELESVSSLPFVLGLKLLTHNEESGNITYTERYTDHEISAVAKAISLKELLLKGADIQLYSLDRALVVGTMQTTPNIEPVISEAEAALLEIAEVASFFEWNLLVHATFDNLNLDLHVLLLSIVRRLPLPVESITATIAKGANTIEMIGECLHDGAEFVGYFEELVSPLVYWGTTVNTGPLKICSVAARVMEPSVLLERLEQAKEGERVEIRFSASAFYAEKSQEEVRHLYIRPLVPSMET